MSATVANVLAVAAGGATGALARYGLSNALYKHFGVGFPYGTVGVNILGSLLMGVLFVFVIERPMPDVWRLALTVGLLGAFNTFSTFSLDTLILIEEGEVMRALTNVVVSVVLCLVAVFAGAALARAMLPAG
jgi:CrcB protein